MKEAVNYAAITQCSLVIGPWEVGDMAQGGVESRIGRYFSIQRSSTCHFVKVLLSNKIISLCRLRKFTSYEGLAATNSESPRLIQNRFL